MSQFDNRSDDVLIAQLKERRKYLQTLRWDREEIELSIKYVTEEILEYREELNKRGIE